MKSADHHSPDGLSCEEAQRSIAWLLDDELDTEQAREVEAHLRACSACDEVLQREGRLRLAVRRVAESDGAPESLKARVGRTIDRERRYQRTLQRTWPAVTAAAVLASFIWQGATGNAGAQDLEEAAVRHARNLPMDVIAGECGKVEQYFDGKLPFAVHVPDVVRNQPVSVQLGGRVVDLANREAAYVRYDLPRGRMSVFVYPESRAHDSEVMPLYRVGERRIALRQVRGYNAAQWHARGLVYSVVTDLPEHELAAVLTQGLERF